MVDTADGAYLISDILETSIHQSLTKPSFSTGWRRVKSLDNKAEDPTKFFVYDSEPVAAGALYYIGYNENFGNYKAGGDDPATFRTKPSTPRLRIGLAHAVDADGMDLETDKQREDVDFDAYRIRIVDEDGDVVPEGHDVATVASDYGTGDFRAYDPVAEQPTGPKLTADNKLFLYGVTDRDDTDLRFSLEGTLEGTLINNEEGNIIDSGIALHNVRIVDGTDIAVPMYRVPVKFFPRTVVEGRDGLIYYVSPPASVTKGKVHTRAGYQQFGNPEDDVFAEPPDEHRDFPIDILASDETYTITAWAINDDDDVISPVATLTVRPVDKTVTLSDKEGFADYLNRPEGSGENRVYTVKDGTLTITEFTVLK